MDFQLDLSTETIDQAYPAEPPCIEPQVSVRQVLRHMRDMKRGCVLICRDNKLEGVFTERDALKVMAGGAELDQPIENVMVRDPVTLSSHDVVGKAISKMSFGGYRRLPIVDDDGQPVGIMKVTGILRYLVEHFPNVVYTLPPAPHHSTQEREGA